MLLLYRPITLEQRKLAELTCMLSLTLRLSAHTWNQCGLDTALLWPIPFGNVG